MAIISCCGEGKKRGKGEEGKMCCVKPRWTQCFGAFGEVNEDLDKVVQCLAREAASSDEGLTISPLVNTDRKGRAYRIMIQ